ncbi:YciI family protein [Phytomonospora sp. NPDC050363]|uniref:YciI family protein n=1 Tax=Phytomonospora sp. NPDC050363 TaxID=3155642 RepID=UPI0033EDAFCC
MLHLLLLTFTGAPEDAAPYTAAHMEYLERHYGAGTFLAYGPTVPASVGGGIIARGVGREEVERITSEDPFVAAGVISYAITTIDLAQAHPALADLLAGS